MIIKHGRHIHKVRKGLWAWLCFSDADWLGKQGSFLSERLGLDQRRRLTRRVTNALISPKHNRHSRMMTSQGTHGMVAGWGLNERLHETSVLKKVCVPVVRNSTCQQKTPFPFSSNMFCAGTGSKDSCRGDSGGGFAVYDRQQKAWFLGGIVSWGTSSACFKQNYGIYVRVDRYVDWIKKVVYSP